MLDGSLAVRNSIHFLLKVSLSLCSLYSLSALACSLFLLDKSLTYYKAFAIVSSVRTRVIAFLASSFSNVDDKFSIVVAQG
jgi:hypothetical protein